MTANAFPLSDPVPLELESLWATTDSDQSLLEQVPLDYESQLKTTNQAECRVLTTQPHSTLSSTALDLSTKPVSIVPESVPLDLDSVWSTTSSSQSFSESVPLGSESVPLDLYSIWNSEQVPWDQVETTNQECLFSTTHSSSTLYPTALNLSTEFVPIDSEPVPLNFSRGLTCEGSFRTDQTSLTSRSPSSCPELIDNSLQVPLSHSFNTLNQDQMGNILQSMLSARSD